MMVDRGLTLISPRVALPALGGSEVRHMRKNQANYRVVSRVVKPITLGLLLVSLVACATAPIDKARLQADKDWAQAVER